MPPDPLPAEVGSGSAEGHSCPALVAASVPLPHEPSGRDPVARLQLGLEGLQRETRRLAASSPRGVQRGLKRGHGRCPLGGRAAARPVLCEGGASC
eukprot:8480026-Alexandrium_andersonii.AAC.1